MSSPTKLYQNKAAQYGLQQSTIKTDAFDLTVFTNGLVNTDASSLHVYIEGDGQPFIQKRYINRDPTSRKGVALELLALDDTPSVLIGRPCYHQPNARNCQDSKWWTSHRYSQEVVDAMTQALQQLNIKHLPTTLIGHSGGGALAMLVATEIKEITNIVTINANINPREWTQHHGYTPLFGSLNPIDYFQTIEQIHQLNLIGEQDKNIPYSTWLKQLNKPANSEVRIIPNFTHSCCWKKLWPNILNEIGPNLSND